MLQTVKGQMLDSIDKSSKKSNDCHSLKHHQNKEAARICLISGAGLIAVGGIVAIAGLANYESSATPIGV